MVFRGRLVWKCIPHRSSFVVCAADVLHHCAASTLLLGRVGVFALVDLKVMCQYVVLIILMRYKILTVPHRLGTMKSFGSLSVNAMRLRDVSEVLHA